MHIAVPTKTRLYASRIHLLKMIIVQDGEGMSVPRNIKLTKLFCILKIANEASETFSKAALETIQIVSVTSGQG